MDTITVEELKKRLDAGEKLNIVDVREPYEHEEFNIGGLLYPLGNIRSMDVEELEPYKDEELILYCRSGNRSGPGYSRVYQYQEPGRRYACLAGKIWKLIKEEASGAVSRLMPAVLFLTI
jgi:hypothetical protein